MITISIAAAYIATIISRRYHFIVNLNFQLINNIYYNFYFSDIDSADDEDCKKVLKILTYESGKISNFIYYYIRRFILIRILLFIISINNWYYINS